MTKANLKENKASVSVMSSVICENPEHIIVSIPSHYDYELDLSRVFHPSPQTNNALLILNQKINIPSFLQLWDNYQLRICADGGANRLYDYFNSKDQQQDHRQRVDYLPDYIIGDLDSLRDDVKQWYQSKGVTVIKQATQYCSDLGKCLDFIQIHYEYQQRSEKVPPFDEYDGIKKLCSQLTDPQAKVDVLIVGGINGRFDHTIHSINTLTQSISTPMSLHFITSTDLITLIQQGVSVLHTPKEFCGWNCGLLPMIQPVVLSSKGLKWDVEDWDSKIGGDVSSSNRIVGEDKIVLKTDGPFVLSIELDYEKLDI